MLLRSSAKICLGIRTADYERMTGCVINFTPAPRRGTTYAETGTASEDSNMNTSNAPFRRSCSGCYFSQPFAEYCTNWRERGCWHNIFLDVSIAILQPPEHVIFSLCRRLPPGEKARLCNRPAFFFVTSLVYFPALMLSDNSLAVASKSAASCLCYWRQVRSLYKRKSAEEMLTWRDCALSGIVATLWRAKGGRAHQILQSGCPRLGR
jgi:hypothetical protein